MFSEKKTLPFPVAQKQRGVATILVILLISLAMTATAIGVVYSVQGTQELQVAAHAKTHSQASAWAGVEVFRKYLYALSDDPASLGNLSGTLTMNIASHAPTLSAEIVTVQAPAGTSATDNYVITANIRSYDAAAKSSSVIQVVYRVAPFMCSGNTDLNSTLDFHRDLSMGGDITVLSDPGQISDFYVDGSITMASISATGVSALYATGDVTLDSGVYLPEVRSNANITLSGSASIGKAKAVGTLSTAGSARVITEAHINGDITYGGGDSGALNSLGNVTIDTWKTIGSINSAGTVTIGGGPIGDIAAMDDVTIDAWTDVGNITSEGDVFCPSSWTSYISINAVGTEDCSGSAEGGKTLSVDVMDEVQPFTMEPVKVDAWALKSEANYVFEYDGKIRVTVQHVNGVTNGQYVVGNHSNGKKDYLCNEVNGAGLCTSPADPTLKICNGQSPYNTCFSYDNSTKTFTISGKNMAPGLVWAHGNLSLGNGQYYNTFIATGNLTTSNSHKTHSINFAGYDVICTNQFPVNPSSDFTGLYPENFCDMSNGVLTNNALGNIALLAGGYDPNFGGNFRGGDITLGASTEIFGTVMAGDYLFTGGDTTIHGYISASGQGTAAANVSNTLGGSTTINLQNLPSSFDPTKVPNMDASVGNCGVSDTQIAKTFWSRLL